MNDPLTPEACLVVGRAQIGGNAVTAFLELLSRISTLVTEALTDALGIAAALAVVAHLHLETDEGAHDREHDVIDQRTEQADCQQIAEQFTNCVSRLRGSINLLRHDNHLKIDTLK